MSKRATTREAAFYAFIRERESIRLRREQGQPWPWTDDPILRQYKFTNVRREHDATSRALNAEFYHRHPCSVDTQRKQALLNCATFRYFGTIEFARALGWQQRFEPDRIVGLASRRLATKQRVFTGAYVITNQGIKAPKEQVVVHHFLGPLWDKADWLVQVALAKNSWREVADRMATLQGFGGTGFMTKEVLLDTMQVPGFWPTPRPSDYWTWTPVGPGARRGLERVYGACPTDALRRELLWRLHGLQIQEWSDNWGKLSPHDIQFQLCEFDKYERTRLGQGRPRSTYVPPEKRK
jgi:hypothetical protein